MQALLLEELDAIEINEGGLLSEGREPASAKESKTPFDPRIVSPRGTGKIKAKVPDAVPAMTISEKSAFRRHKPALLRLGRCLNEVLESGAAFGDVISENDRDRLEDMDAEARIRLVLRRYEAKGDFGSLLRTLKLDAIREHCVDVVLALEDSEQEERDSTQRQHLKTFYQSTGGEGGAFTQQGGKEWKGGRKNWLTIEPLDTWQGLQFNGAGFIVSIKLVGHGLTGSLPECLTDLNTLEELHLEDNQLEVSQRLFKQVQSAGRL
jgi:hypothetical protein